MVVNGYGSGFLLSVEALLELLMGVSVVIISPWE
jgi:hypothetical protein